MNALVCCFVTALGIAGATDVSGLEDIRRNYQQAVTDKQLCAQMIQHLDDRTDSDVHLAYLGGFQALWAKHTINPVAKLRTFNKGRGNIDRAARKAPGHPEIIFVRHSVQKNSPAFLGYKDRLEEDRAFLSGNLDRIASPVLKKMVESVLKAE